MRRAAEARLAARPAPARPRKEAHPQRPQHELEVLRVELEMQNEELRVAQAETAAGLVRYIDLFDFAPVGYFNLTADGTIQLVNLTGAKLVATERGRLLGRRFGQFVAESDRRGFRDFLARVFAAGIPQTCELTLAAEDGHPLSVHLEAALSPDGLECRVVLLDTTEREQAKAKLAASERYLRGIFDTEPECVKLLGPDGSLRQINRAGLKMLEADSFEQVVGLCVYPLIVPEHRAKFQELTGRVFRGESGTLEFQLVGLKGTTLWLEIHATPLRNEQCEIISLLGVTRDITEPKRAEAINETMLFLATRLGEASAPKEEARIIFDAADQLWDWDAGTLDVYSAAEDRVWAVMYFDIVDGKRREVPAAENSEEPTPRMRRIRKDGPELILRTPPYTQRVDSMMFGDTSRLSASLLCVPVRNQGRPVGVLSIQSYSPNAFVEADLELLQGLADYCGGTLERIRVAEALRSSEERLRALVETIHRLNTELEQRVDERTAQLVAANRELEAFSHSISHDLRVPLRHIEGFISMAVEKSGDQISAEVRRHLQTAVDSAKQMNQLIKDLLAFSRTNQAELHAMPLDLNHLVREVIHGLALDTQGRAIEWNIQTLPEVRADRALLRQVWANLIGNALKFTRQRARGRIEIGAQPAETEVVVFIRDNGVGFDPHYADRLFGVFQRLHSAEQFEGTGIGLANVQRIIRRHGGRVWAEGKVDEGATFYFALPTTLQP